MSPLLQGDTSTYWLLSTLASLFLIICVLLLPPSVYLHLINFFFLLLPIPFNSLPFFPCSEIADVFNCLTYLAYNSLYNLEVSERIFSAVRDIPAPGPAVSVPELARQVALALAAGHTQQDALLASLPHLLQANVLLTDCCRQMLYPDPTFYTLPLKLNCHCIVFPFTKRGHNHKFKPCSLETRCTGTSERPNLDAFKILIGKKIC
jgi:hypothetical protein